jgi:hypothetical protein
MFNGFATVVLVQNRFQSFPDYFSLNIWNRLFAVQVTFPLQVNYFYLLSVNNVGVETENTIGVKWGFNSRY